MSRKQLDDILKYAADRGIPVPADVVLDLAKKDTQKAISEIELQPDDLPLFTLEEPGAVPAPKQKGLILTSTGWGKENKNIVYAAVGGGGSSIEYPLAANLGGTGIANAAASTLTLWAATSITGGGTIALGGYTLTVPATGSAAG